MKFKDLGVNTPQELLQFMQENIQYGFTNKGKVYLENDKNFDADMDRLYKLKVKEDLLKSGYGVCWDTCEFERRFFEEMKIPHKCYFYLSFLARDEGGPTHTFLLYENDKKVNWFEFSWGVYRGIWQYDSKKEALADILEKFCKFYERPFEKVEIYEFPKARAGLNTFDFVEHCISGKQIDMGKVLEENSQ